jgi:hypothetical protein
MLKPHPKWYKHEIVKLQTIESHFVKSSHLLMHILLGHMFTSYRKITLFKIGVNENLFFFSRQSLISRFIGLKTRQKEEEKAICNFQTKCYDMAFKPFLQQLVSF